MGIRIATYSNASGRGVKFMALPPVVVLDEVYRIEDDWRTSEVVLLLPLLQLQVSDVTLVVR